MNRNFKKLLCICLSVIMIMQILPMTVWGADVQNGSLPELINSEEEEVQIIQELTSESTDYEKTYIAEDGSKVLVSDLNNSIDTPNISTYSLNQSGDTDGIATLTLKQTNTAQENNFIIGNSKKNFAVLEFNLSELKNSFVKNAYISLDGVNITSPKEKVIVAPLKTKFVLGRNPSIATTKICDYAKIDTSLNGKTITLDITKILNSWITDTTNNGLIIYNSNNDSTDEFSNINITINYMDISEADNNIESEIINLDRAGTVYINDFNGAPTIVRNEIGLDGYIAPVQIQSVLNPYNENSKFTGSNFRINYESTISYDAQDVFIWNTCNGEKLYFTLVASKTLYKEYNAVDSSGNKCTLKWNKENNSYDPNNLSNIKIIDADDCEYHFNSNGFLTEILTKSNNNSKITIDYATYTDENSNNYYRFAAITDGAGRVYKFFYDDNHQLTKIGVYKLTDGEYVPLKLSDKEISIKYEYNDSGLLEEVIYPDNIEINADNEEVINGSVKYQYDNRNRISSIVSNTDNSMNFIYTNNDNLSMLNGYSVKDSANVDIQKITFDYGETYRRTLTNNLLKENTTSQKKILDFNKSYDLIYLEEYDNKNYFLNYDNGELKNVLNERAANNLIAFGNFDNENGKYSETSDYYDYWYDFGDGTVDVSEDTGRRLRSSDECLVIGNTSSGTTGSYQMVQGDFKAGEKYIIEAYAKASSAVAIRDDRVFSILVSSSESDEGIPISSDTIAQMNYQPYITNWQLQKQIITIPEDTNELFVYLCYANMEGDCYFDSVKLYKYEENVESAPIDNTEYTYDNYGRLVKESLTEKTPLLGSIKNVKEKTYNYNGNNLTSTTENGITTYYNYDSSNGLLLSSNIADNQTDAGIRYSYNGMGALESIQQVIHQIDNDEINDVQINTTYAYDHDNVVGITHNGFTYDISYDALGNISDVKINNTSLYSFDHKFKNDNNVSKITYGDGTSLIYQKSINKDYFNVVDIYEAKQTNIDISKLDYKYEFKYDYDGTLVEYIDNENGTTSVWHNGTHVIYDCVDITFLNSINSLLRGEINLNDLTEVPIYQYTEAYSGSYLGQSYTLSNTDIFNNSFSTLSTSTSVKVNNLTKTTVSDRYYYSNKEINNTNDLKDLISDKNYTVAKTTTDGFGRTEKSSIISLFDKTGVYNKYSYKNLGENKTTDLISEYETYYGGVNSSEEVLESSSLLYRRYEYKYNSKGQITDVYLLDKNLFDETTLENIGNGVESVKVQHYEYDELGQLTKEINLKTNKAIIYRYDAGGNIIEKRIYHNKKATKTEPAIAAFEYDSNSNELELYNCTDIVTYGYNDANWKDLMTSYNDVNISYDNSGNPLNYFGLNIFNQEVIGTMEWNGKKLVSFTDEASQNRYEYKYNADGLRTQKKIYTDSNIDTPSSVIDYFWNNDKLEGYIMSSYNEDGSKKISMSIKPIYDVNNNLMGITYEFPDAETGEKEDITLPILRDGLGNVTDFFTTMEKNDENGSQDIDTVLHYDYDAYGNCVLNFSGTNITDFANTGNVAADILLGIIYILAMALVITCSAIFSQQNYRGYLYDIETGLYYNQTRYYSPSWCRFLNCDNVNILTKDAGEVLGANLFKYCDNDPINYTDPSGFSQFSNLYDNSLLSLMGIATTDASKLNIAKTSVQNIIDSKLIESSLLLTPQKQDIWNELFDNNAQTVYKNNGYNYLSSHIDSSGNDNAKMFNSIPKTPYNTKTINNN